MNDSKISVRYAKALFQAAEEAKVLPQVMQDIDLIMKVYNLADFRAVIDSPVVKTSDKKKVSDSLFSGKVSDLTMSFIELILANKRESYLSHIARNFKTLYKKSQGILSAEIVVSESIDKSQILGGFILRVEDEQFDASVSSELAKIKRQLLESSSVK